MQVIEHLNHLHLVVSHTSLIRKLDELGEDFDRLVHKWKDGESGQSILINHEVFPSFAIICHACVLCVYRPSAIPDHNGQCG